MRIHWRALRLASGLVFVCAAGAIAHDDLVGTRYVALEGVDQGECTSNHDPCRTITYAMQFARSGDAIKVGEGTYDFSAIDIENALFGKQGLRGGYSVDEHFRLEDPVNNPTRITGADPMWRNTLVAHGFMPLDASGQPMPAAAVQVQAPTACINGAAGQFPCWNIDFISQIPLSSFSSQPTSASNLWGFVDADDNREYAVLGLRNGTAVIDVTDPATPREVAIIPGVLSAWREVKVYQHQPTPGAPHRAYAYISTEGAGGGLQVIDLSGLPNTATLAHTVTDISTSHTLYISNVNYSTNKPLPGQQAFLYLAGSNVAGGRYRIYDLTDPVTPRLLTTNPGVPGATSAQYMHDSTSLLVTDNRATQCANAHNPCEVLVDFNEDRVELWDVTDKSAPAHLGGATFPTARYVHSGWPSSDGRFIITHDELDELRIAGLNTSIYTLDIGDLRTPTFQTSFTGAVTATDHNGYMVADRYHVSHYKRGLVIFNASSPQALTEIGYFDTFLLPAANTAGTDGAWGVYPFLPSGTLMVSDIENGLFLLRRNETSATPPVQTPPPTPPPPSGSGGGGGGGGATDRVTLLVLLLVLLPGLVIAARRRVAAPARARAARRGWRRLPSDSGTPAPR